MTPTTSALIDTAGVAELLGVRTGSVRNYRNIYAPGGREPAFPEPACMYGRAPVWRRRDVIRWNRKRSGKGVGGGRPPQEASSA